MSTEPDPDNLQLKVGFEIHQQLATKSKLFCNCSCKEADSYYFSFHRKLRPAKSEMGTLDPAALFEFSKMRSIQYFASAESSCLVEADEEPPGDIDIEALESSLIFALALDSKIVDEVHVMRKIVIDGSNTSGFQRTMLIAVGGGLAVGEKKIGVQSICLEEDASKLLPDQNKSKSYGLDRLGVPLVEIALEPVTGKPEEIKQVALTLGRLLRASKRVARGLGTIRQDVNISIQGGKVVEIKGVQQLDQLAPIIEFEMKRQHGLNIIATELKKRGISNCTGGVTDVTQILSHSESKIVRKILESSNDACFKAIRISGFAGMLGFEPYPSIRLGRELGKLVSYYGLNGVFHSDELPNYGIEVREVEDIKETTQTGPSDAFVLIGGPISNVDLAVVAVMQRMRDAILGVPAETRAATPDGQTVYLRPRPGSARMYPETDIPPITVTNEILQSLRDRVPKPWDELVESLSKKFSINKKLANQIFDSDYLDLFYKIVEITGANPTFVASKLTEDIVSLQRKGFDSSNLTQEMILEVFQRLQNAQISKESIVQIFEALMKKSALSVEDAVSKLGATSMTDADLSMAIDKIIEQNIGTVRLKGLDSLGTLMGRAMAELRGKADGQRINSMLKAKIAKMVG